MKITLFATVAMSAVIGIALADEMFNNWNNDNSGFGGVSTGLGHISGGSFGQFSSGHGSGYGIGSGYGSGYSSGYGAGGSYGYGAGGSYGYGASKAAYVPVSPLPKAGGSGIGSFLPIFFLLFLLPLLFSQSSNQDQIYLINSTLEG